MCVKEKGIRTCAECEEFTSCKKLDFLKPIHPNLMKDLDMINDKGFDAFVSEVVAKFKLDPLVID
ncbi:MAG: hypothetical protein ACTSRW_15125 [Candidatus Helarchaeota archaeon]